MVYGVLILLIACPSIILSPCYLRILFRIDMALARCQLNNDPY